MKTYQQNLPKIQNKIMNITISITANYAASFREPERDIKGTRIQVGKEGLKP